MSELYLRNGTKAGGIRANGSGHEPKCRVALTFVSEARHRPEPAWEPMSRRQFSELGRGARLRDRGGRGWTVHAPAYSADGRELVVLRSGDLVRQVDERFADDYMLLSDDEAAGA